MLKKGLFLGALMLVLFTGCSDDAHKNQKSEDDNKSLFHAIDNSQLSMVKTPQGYAPLGEENKIIIFDIFATWCPPCRAEAAVLSDIQKRYPQEVRVIGISVEKNIDDAKLLRFASRYHADYTILNSPKNELIIQTIIKDTGIGERFAIPLVVMYKNGKLVNYYSGATEEEFILSDIKHALKEQ